MRFKKEKKVFVSAVVVAAGTSSRMEGIEKQLVEIAGIPTVIRSLLLFQNSKSISEIVLVCREELIPTIYSLLPEYDLHKVVSVVAGGGDRQDSVFRGLDVCSEQAAFFVIHDGARPLAEPYILEECLQTAQEMGAAAVGVPVKDTIKVCDAQRNILSTPNRQSLFMVQTPQIFAADLYRKARHLAEATGRRYTDDCQLVENAGHMVRITQGSYRNIKITTPEDIALAEMLLAYWEMEN